MNYDVRHHATRCASGSGRSGSGVAASRRGQTLTLFSLSLCHLLVPEHPYKERRRKRGRPAGKDNSVFPLGPPASPTTLSAIPILIPLRPRRFSTLNHGSTGDQSTGAHYIQRGEYRLSRPISDIVSHTVTIAPIYTQATSKFGIPPSLFGSPASPPTPENETSRTPVIPLVHWSRGRFVVAGGRHVISAISARPWR
ncbi:uncharacterized protein CLUP02_11125 [Colletotrichum lupini]|uniref:Uncharacterized protein n=1 Tax=Colletotrichum lupini TaxID=145971 RepID=A0A9Q8WJI8_9PEZI|nr:uncharacterized protein CLUP02_11125 [Colletotrichum lupini]UQC85626.1 hypothetical protein CLUP02_11125 [Colletotrichum lupini]